MTRKPPDGLSKPGRALWRRVVSDLGADWELDGREASLLEAACRQQDVISSLEAAVERDGEFLEGRDGQPRLHPAVPEVRQARVVLSRLLGAIELPSGQQGKPTTTASQRGRRAAEVRWGGRAA